MKNRSLALASLLCATLAAFSAVSSPAAEPVAEPTPVVATWDFVATEGWAEIDETFSGEVDANGRIWNLAKCHVYPDVTGGDDVGYIYLLSPGASCAVAPAFRGVVTSVTTIFRPALTGSREATLLASLDGGATFNVVTNYALPSKQNFENTVVFEPPLDGGDFGVIFCASNSSASGSIHLRRLTIEGTSISPEEPGIHDWSPFGSNAAAQPSGALSGAVLFLDPGLGYAVDAATNGWVTGAGLDRGVVEDFGNLDQMNFFAQQAWKAGATIVPMRPLGYQPNEVVIDNVDTNVTLASRVTFGGAWADAQDAPYHGLADDVGYRWTYACPTGTTAWASYRPDIPAAGHYPVYAWAGAGSNRVDQLYRVRHAGGVTDVRVDHRLVGNGWVWLGDYRFEAGADGYVTVVNHAPGADESGIIVADAIRFGNGMGDIARGDAGVSGLERELEAARYWIERQALDAQGLPADLYDADGSDRADDALAPFLMAEQMCCTNDLPRWRRLFLSFRSDAVDVVGDGAFDRLALHDPSADAETLKSLRGREALASAALRNAVRHLAGLADSAVQEVFAPDAPVAITARGDGFGRVVVSWRMPSFADKTSDPHTGFVIYTSTDGYGFGHPVQIASTANEGSYTFSDLPADESCYFRVCAVNAGGESLPSPVAGARLSSDGSKAKILVVDAFRRTDSGITPTRRYDRIAGLSDPADIPLVRPRMINSFDYVKEHGNAIAASQNGYFDSMDATLVTASDLASHPVVVWCLGRESAETETLSHEEQQLISGFIRNYGALFVSGTDIGRDLDLMGSAADRDFLANMLSCVYLSDDVTTNSVSGNSSTYFAKLSSFSFNYADAPPDTYAAGRAEVFRPQGNGFVGAKYDDADVSQGAIIARQYGTGRTVVMGFPFETIADGKQRARVMKKVLDMFDENTVSPNWIGDTAYTTGIGGEVLIDLKTQVTGYPSPAVTLVHSLDSRTGKAVDECAYIVAEDWFIFNAGAAGISSGTYTFTFKASNSAGGDIEQEVIISVGNSPIWQTIPDWLVDLDEEAVINLYRYVSGDPTPDLALDPAGTDADPATYTFDATEGLLAIGPVSATTNSIFSFAATNVYGDASVTFNVIIRRLDTDDDGIPDWWAKKYFGDATACNPNLDSDGDRLTNREECEAGTDPIDRYSRTTPAYLEGAEELVRKNWIDWAIDWNASTNAALETAFLLGLDPAAGISDGAALLKIVGFQIVDDGCLIELASDAAALFQPVGQDGTYHLGNGIAVIEVASDLASLTNASANLRVVPATIEGGRAIINYAPGTTPPSFLFLRPSIRTRGENGVEGL